MKGPAADVKGGRNQAPILGVVDVADDLVGERRDGRGGAIKEGAADGAERSGGAPRKGLAHAANLGVAGDRLSFGLSEGECLRGELSTLRQANLFAESTFLPSNRINKIACLDFMNPNPKPIATVASGSAICQTKPSCFATAMG